MDDAVEDLAQFDATLDGMKDREWILVVKVRLRSSDEADLLRF
jgi:hypothetical protein